MHFTCEEVINSDKFKTRLTNMSEDSFVKVLKLVYGTENVKVNKVTTFDVNDLDSVQEVTNEDHKAMDNILSDIVDCNKANSNNTNGYREYDNFGTFDLNNDLAIELVTDNRTVVMVIPHKHLLEVKATGWNGKPITKAERYLRFIKNMESFGGASWKDVVKFTMAVDGVDPNRYDTDKEKVIAPNYYRDCTGKMVFRPGDKVSMMSKWRGNKAINLSSLFRHWTDKETINGRNVRVIKDGSVIEGPFYPNQYHYQYR